MKTGIYLSYIGLGANLLHLAYCHEIYKKYIQIIYINSCLKQAIQCTHSYHRLNQVMVPSDCGHGLYRSQRLEIYKLSRSKCEACEVGRVCPERHK